ALKRRPTGDLEMINLLSPNDKKQLRAARSNVLLLRYNILVVITILAVGGVFGGGFFITMQERANAEARLAEDAQRTASYSSTRKQAEDFAKNLTTAKTILSQEISYSQLIIDIAKTLPKGSVLTDLNLNAESFSKPLTVGARTKSYDGAVQLKNTLEQSDLFNDVSIINIIRDDGRRDYPVTVTLNASLTPKAGAQ
ncbi:MAG TPA: hypothetical protein VFZ48_01390, partial [Candidatus Saccharimonadales bacterium]